MTLSRTLSIYIARVFILAIIGVFVTCSIVIYIADLAELMRRASGKEGLEFYDVAAMAMYKLPGMAERFLPFAVLIGSMLAFHGLSRRHELVVARAAGISVWQFTAPACAVVLVFGLFSITVYNPLAAHANGVYERLEAEYLSGGTRGIMGNLSGNLWLRQSNRDGAAVMSAQTAMNQGLELHDVVVYQFGQDEIFLSRTYAERATLEPGRWRLENAWVTGRDGSPLYVREHWVDTALSRTEVTESLASPSAISFWDLPRFVAIAERAGLSANRYRVHYQALLAQPVLFCSMVLVAATFSLRLVRLGHVTRMVIAGLIVGFVLFLANHVAQALGANGAIPPTVAAWGPVAIALLGSLTLLFYQEDG